MTPPTKGEAPKPIARAAWRRGQRWAPALRGLLVALVLAGSLSAGSASLAGAAGTCTNAAVRAESGSAGLPECRGYEMVTPPFKEGFRIEPGNSFWRFTDDGVVSYASTGTFAGNPQGLTANRYHATRSGEGWATTALAPPDALYNTLENTVQGESADLRWSLWEMSRRDVPGDKFSYYLRGPDGAFTRVGVGESVLGPQPFAAGMSPDLSHIVFNYGGGSGVFSALYEYVGTGNDGPPRAVSIDNLGQPTPALTCINDLSPDGHAGGRQSQTAGRVIVYTSGCGVGIAQVWARVAGTATVAVSGSECTRASGDPGGACNGVSAAAYEGGAADGSRVFFTTSQQLVNGDTDTGNDLYACDIPAGVPAPTGAANPCASLTQVSGTATNAQVENVVATAEDGSRVYFVAQGVLASNLGAGDVGAATGPSAHNLYVWERDGAHPAGTTQFVASLDASDIDSAEGGATPDGRYLAFLTASKLVAQGPGRDDDDAVDAYRYDAVTKAMVRMSTSVSGGGGNSPAPSGNVSMVANSSTITADGSTVIFDTAEGLAAEDTNGVTDVYSWHDDGRVSLISKGGGDSMGITASGRDIFFLSDAPVLPTDRDLNKDIYDARIGGGFAADQSVPCAGDGCRGPRSQPPGLVEPSAPPTGSGGPAETSPALSLRPVSAAQRRALATTGKLSLTVTANVPGTIGVNATATIGGRSTTVASGRRTLIAAGRATVTLSLSKKARGQLRSRGRLTIKVTVSHSKVALDRTATLRLVRAKANAKGSVERISARRSVASGGKERS